MSGESEPLVSEDSQSPHVQPAARWLSQPWADPIKAFPGQFAPPRPGLASLSFDEMVMTASLGRFALVEMLKSARIRFPTLPWAKKATNRRTTRWVRQRHGDS